MVNGSPTQMAMMEDAGGQSKLAHVTTAAVVGLVLLFLTGPLQYLPTCVLGVLVFMVALRLINLNTLRDIRAETPKEYALAVMTAAVVVLVGVEQGIVLGHHLSEGIGQSRMFNRLHDAIAAFEELPKPLEEKASEPLSNGTEPLDP